MHILIGLAMALALLYFWLIGHWFARVVMFLALAAFLFLVGVAVVPDPRGSDAAATANLVVGIVGVVVAWPLAGLPVYYWRHRLKVMIEQEFTSPPSPPVVSAHQREWQEYAARH